MPHLRRTGLAHPIGLASTRFGGPARGDVAMTLRKTTFRKTTLRKPTLRNMTVRNESGDRRSACALGRGQWVPDWRGALSSLAVLALTGCGLSDGAGALFVDPGRYTLYHCDDLAARRKVLIARENELRGLIERAGESPGGAVVGSFAYRSDYDTVIAEEKLLQRDAAEKKCSFVSPLQSDQTIR